MKKQRFSSGAISKGILIIFLVLLAFSSYGIAGYAAPVEEAFYLQDGDPSDTLFCSSDPTVDESGGFCNVQIVLMIDDSGSMKWNDPQNAPGGGLRNQGASHLVDVLVNLYYLPIRELQDENSDIELPVVQVAVIHFTEGLLNEDKIQWVTIEPQNREQWDIQKDLPGGINDLINLDYKPNENTSFIEPFAKAQELFELSQLDGGCDIRSIMLFTDGAPYHNGLMRGDRLKEHMSLVKSSVDTINNLPTGEDVKVYITAFNTDSKYKDYWKEEARTEWWNSVTEIDKLDPLGVSRTLKDKQDYDVEIKAKINEFSDPGRIQLLPEERDGDEGLVEQDVRVQLTVRMEEITADLISLEREELVAESLTIPSYVQSVRLTLFNIASGATLEITDPDGNLLTADSSNVIVSGEDSAIETWDLDQPAAGEYQVKATLPGGTITSLIAYQQVSVQFVDLPDKLKVSEPADINLKLSGAAEALDLTLFVSLNGGNPTPLDLTQDGDGFSVAWTPPAEGEAVFTIKSGAANVSCQPEVIRPIVEDEIKPDPTLEIFYPEMCVPEGELIKVPVRVNYDGPDRSWADSLYWLVEAAETGTGQRLDAVISTVDAVNGDYLVTIDPAGAKEVMLKVTAEAEINGEKIVISDGIETTYPICDTPVCECEIWLIFIWLMMWVVVFLMGWVLIQGGKINLKFRLLVVLEIALAVIWYILFVNYRMYLLWMLILLAVLVFFLLIVYRRRIRNMLTWWLFILLTLFVSVWFVVFGGFSAWLIVLLLLFWLGILILLWLFFWQIDPGPSWIIWLVLLLLLVAVIVAFVYFSSYWIILLVWLLVMLVIVLIIRVAGPFCPPTVIAPPDDLTVIEGIGPKVQQLLYEHGVNTFEKLKNAEIDDLNEMLNSADYDYMDPKTWPYQAELAQKAKETGKAEDQEAFEKYKTWVKDGISPDEYNRPEDERTDEVKKPPEEE